MKAFVVNRFGDFGFIIGLFLLFWSLGGIWEPRADARSVDATCRRSATRPTRPPPNPFESTGPRAAVVDGHAIKLGPTLNFRELRDQVVIEGTGVGEHLRHQKVWGIALLTLVGMLMFVGAMGKSAQLPALRLAPRRHGRSHAGLGPHPRRHHGDGRRLHGGPAQLPLRHVPHRHGLGGDRRRRSPPSSPPPSASSSTTSRRCWPTPRCRSSASCSWAWAWAPTGPAPTTCSPTPSSRPRLFLGVGLGDPGLPPRAGHAEDGRAEEAHAGHRLDLPRRHLGHRRLPLGERLLLEGRDPLEGLHPAWDGALRDPGALARAGHLRDRPAGRHRAPASTCSAATT